MSQTSTDEVAIWVLLALVAMAIGVAAAIVSRRRSHRRRMELRQRFGPEYEREVEENGEARAERELAARARRVEHLPLRELSDFDRARFLSMWNVIQSQFVDQPAEAVASANELIKSVVLARGYPPADFDQRVADLSVDHGPVIQHYRAARALSRSSASGPIDTEELRQAIVHYRALFTDLLQEPQHTQQSLHPVRAH
jgi:hypothetical protein